MALIKLCICSVQKYKSVLSFYFKKKIAANSKLPEALTAGFSYIVTTNLLNETLKNKYLVIAALTIIAVIRSLLIYTYRVVD